MHHFTHLKINPRKPPYSLLCVYAQLMNNSFLNRHPVMILVKAFLLLQSGTLARHQSTCPWTPLLPKLQDQFYWQQEEIDNTHPWKRMFYLAWADIQTRCLFHTIVTHLILLVCGRTRPAYSEDALNKISSQSLLDETGFSWLSSRKWQEKPLTCGQV